MTTPKQFFNENEQTLIEKNPFFRNILEIGKDIYLN